MEDLVLIDSCQFWFGYGDVGQLRRTLARGVWSLPGEQFHDATERDSEDRHVRAADEAAVVAVSPRESDARDMTMLGI